MLWKEKKVLKFVNCKKADFLVGFQMENNEAKFQVSWKF